MTNSFRAFRRVALATLALCLFSMSAGASDLTVFGGIQHQGELTLETAPGSTSNFVRNFDPKTFGVYGARLSAGRVIGSEHTLAYAPNFISSDTHALLYHSNMLIQGPFPVVKPYGTVGFGLIRSGGDSSTPFGTKFALNYGGGAKVMAGPLGVSLDVRGYMIPKFAVEGYDIQQRLNFIQVSAGIVFGFGF